MSSRICKTTKAHGEESNHKFRRFTALSSRKSKQKLQFWLDGIFRPRKGRGVTSSGFRLPHSKAIRFSILVLFVVAGVALSIAPFSRIERFALPRATAALPPEGVQYIDAGGPGKINEYSVATHTRLGETKDWSRAKNDHKHKKTSKYTSTTL